MGKETVGTLARAVGGDPEPAVSASGPAGMAALRRAFPWPDRRPTTGVAFEGWFGPGNARMLRREMESHPAVVVEVGSWMGRSAKFLAEASPDAVVVAVDHWEGSVEHHADAAFRAVLPQLYDCFIQNMWEFRHRVVPVRRSSVAGLEEIARAGVSPALVYIDASHEEPDVLRDIKTARSLFPGARLLGDDWRWKGVRRAVRTAARANGLVIEVDENCWMLHERRTFGRRARWRNRMARAMNAGDRALWAMLKALHVR